VIPEFLPLSSPYFEFPIQSNYSLQCSQLNFFCSGILLATIFR
jgi:hypothetical protein